MVFALSSLGEYHSPLVYFITMKTAVNICPTSPISNSNSRESLTKDSKNLSTIEIIKKLQESGMSDDQIAEVLGLSLEYFNQIKD